LFLLIYIFTTFSISLDKSFEYLKEAKEKNCPISSISYCHLLSIYVKEENIDKIRETITLLPKRSKLPEAVYHTIRDLALKHNSNNILQALKQLGCFTPLDNIHTAVAGTSSGLITQNKIFIN